MVVVMKERASGDQVERVIAHLVELGMDVHRSTGASRVVLGVVGSGKVDPRLIELLYRISQRTHQKIQMVSGFRAPMFSLATLSYHTRGMAADIRIAGMTPLMVRDLARSMGVKGIGYYPVSQFVHVDVRDDRMEWTDYGENRNDSEGGEHDPNRGKTEE